MRCFYPAVFFFSLSPFVVPGNAQDSLPDRFELEFRDLIECLKRTQDSLQEVLYSMEQNNVLTDIQSAQVTYLKTRIRRLSDISSDWYPINDPVVDSIPSTSILT